ncbi:MAG: 30S ribosomal protein S3 [Candidatus Heimdallarchaeota archaeon]|nr:30S ribosomal protein S3 [Candidatus Heimdallarchaeota archaeon]
MPTTKDYLLKKYQRNEIDEYLAEELKNAEYGGVELRRTPLGDRVILKVGRVGLAIGGRGRNIHRITEALREQYDLDNPQIEVTEVENPELDARIMAFRLASSLERGRHFRRSAHGIIRRILSVGAKGIEIKISGKITSQRARVETFRAGFVAKAGDPAERYVDIGKATALIRRGLIGIQVRIMRGDAILPDDITIEAEPTSTSMIVDIGIEEEPEIIEEVSEEVIEELEEFPDIDEELEKITEEESKKKKKKPKDEFEELEEVDKVSKSKKDVKASKPKKEDKKEEKPKKDVKASKSKKEDKEEEKPKEKSKKK